jgi:hypothetical protein
VGLQLADIKLEARQVQQIINSLDKGKTGTVGGGRPAPAAVPLVLLD